MEHTHKVVYRTKERKYVIRKLTLKDKKSSKFIPYTGTLEECQSLAEQLNQKLS